MLDLLPHNATDQERALDLATARIGGLRVPVRDLWSADRCPVALLPWLAWALSVDQWDATWTEAQKRDTVRKAIEVQRIKGTIGAVRASLSALDIDARVLEWHRQETPGAEYTYRLLIQARGDAPVSSIAQILEAIEAVDRTKSLRSHMDEIEVSATSEAGPYFAAVATSGSEIVVKYSGGDLVVSGNNIVVA